MSHRWTPWCWGDWAPSLPACRCHPRPQASPPPLASPAWVPGRPRLAARPASVTVPLPWGKGRVGGAPGAHCPPRGGRPRPVLAGTRPFPARSRCSPFSGGKPAVLRVADAAAGVRGGPVEARRPPRRAAAGPGRLLLSNFLSEPCCDSARRSDAHATQSISSTPRR